MALNPMSYPNKSNYFPPPKQSVATSTTTGYSPKPRRGGGGGGSTPPLKQPADSLVTWHGRNSLLEVK